MSFENERENVGKGWQPIIEQLHKDLLAIDPNYEVAQIKEKFGELRYYFSSDSLDSSLDDYARMHELVGAAEAKSRQTCEWCGEPAKPKSDHGYIRTLCDDCRAKNEEARKKRFS